MNAAGLMMFPADASSADLMTAWSRNAMQQFGFAQLATKLIVRWNSRMRSAAGRAFWPDGIIELNPRLLNISHEEVERTVRHELAHLLAHARAGRRRIAAHGHEWRVACVDLGIADEKVCHRLPFERRVMERRYVYFCPHCAASFSRVRPIKKKSACLACCKKHSGGRYDERFRLRLRLPE
jgi:SprT protein